MIPIHPLTAHFPITLLIVWPAVDAVGLALGRADVSRTAFALLGLGVLSSLITTVTGQHAYDAAIAQGFAPELLDGHAELAGWIPWLGLGLVALRAELARRLGARGHALAIALGALVALAVGYAGHSGGVLAYEHGVGRS